MTDFTPDIVQKKISQCRSASSEKCDPNNTCAAILLPIISKNSEWHLLYTHRTGNVSSHQNEVSFPGGAFEPTDVTLEKTAIRETFEEIGVESKDIRILGELPSSTTITGFKVFPFIGFLNWPIKLIINSNEVDSVFSIPIKWLINSENYYEAEYHSENFGVRKVMHYKDYQGEHLWGYTAKVTQQFLALIK